MNYTYVVNAKDPGDVYYENREGAALDQDCISLIVSNDSPISMLTGIISRRANTGNTAPTPNCVKFHCMVALNSLLSSLGTDLIGNGGINSCTNTRNVKPTAEVAPTYCPCFDEFSKLTLDLSDSFVSLCGSMAKNLNNAEVFASVLQASKDQCYAGTILAAKDSTDKMFTSIWFSNKNCTYLTQSAFTAFEWFELQDKEQVLYEKGNSPYKWSVPSACIDPMCDVFNRSLYDSRCNWKTNKELRKLTLVDVGNVAKYCPVYGFTTQVICSILGNSPVFCNASPTDRKSVV